MHKIKISHEIPKQLFPYHNLISDYPYVLGHLIDLDKEYATYYKSKLKESSFSIFDNSCFELGKSIPSDVLLKLIEEYNPTHFVLPDVLHDFQATINGSLEFLHNYYNPWAESTLKGSNFPKPIGVLQGNNFNELLECFDTYIQHRVDYIAIPFDCIRDSDWHNIRFLFFRELIKKRLTGKMNYPHLNIHFLGLQNPSELLLYTEEEKSWITSIDTSSPIINGWEGNLYTEYGLKTPKPKLKLAENLDVQLTSAQINLIVENVKIFKQQLNGPE